MPDVVRLTVVDHEVVRVRQATSAVVQVRAGTSSVVRITGVAAIGRRGPAGQQGDDGDPGPGVAPGGTTGQVNAKASNADYDTEWIDLPEGGGAVDSVNGAVGVVVLTAADVGADATGTAAGLVASEATSRASADTALDGRLDTLEAISIATDAELAGAVAAEAALRSSADNALDSRLDAIEAVDPLTQTEGDARYWQLSTDLATQVELDAEAALARNADNLTTGTVADARIASTIARDSEVTSAVAAEATARDSAIATAVAAEATLARNGDNITSGTVADARIASTIARDSEVTSAVATEATARDAAIAVEAALARNADNLISGTVADARIASTIARDSEVTSAVATEATARDAAIETHRADTTDVHGIVDTSTLYRAGGTDVAVADGGTGSSTAGAARTALGVTPNVVAPSVQKLLAWNYDPIVSLSQRGINAGQLWCVKIPVPDAISVTNIVYEVHALGSTLTAGQNLVALFNSSGTRVGVSADQAAIWAGGGAVTGVKTTALTSGPFSVGGASTLDYVIVAFLYNGTTTPQFRAAGGTSIPAPNAGLVAADGFRCGTVLSAQTSMPTSITIANIAAANIIPWVALS